MLFANSTTLYVADSGDPKNDFNGDDATSKTNIGDGGLQKWTFNGTNWVLNYSRPAQRLYESRAYFARVR